MGSDFDDDFSRIFARNNMELRDEIMKYVEDIELALTPGYSTASPKARELGFGAGMGLYNMQSVASTFEITSSKEGTHIKMTFK